MNKRIEKQQHDKYIRTTANEILAHWCKELLEKNSTDSFYKIPVEVIDEEIKETKGTIDNCTMMQDELGVLCNKKYIKFLLKIRHIIKEA